MKLYNEKGQLYFEGTLQEYKEFTAMSKTGSIGNIDNENVSGNTPEINQNPQKLYSTDIKAYAPKKMDSWKSYEPAMNKYVTAKVTQGLHCTHILNYENGYVWNKEKGYMEYYGVEAWHRRTYDGQPTKCGAEWKKAIDEYRAYYIYTSKQ